MRKKVFKIKHAKTQLAIFFVVMYFLVNHLEWFKDPESSLISDIRRGVFGTYLFIAYLATLFLPEPTISRPHVLFWRLIQGFTFAYMIVVCFLLFFSKENMQYVLGTVFDKDLGKPLPERSYADDCRVYTPENSESKFYNIANSVDVFVAAHFMGWTMKTWIFRNNVVAWIGSIMFEIFEWTMEVWLENFKECWWDHLLLDMFGCNLIGMLIGIYTINKFNMRKYHWFMEPNEKMEKMTLWQKTKYYFTSREEYIKKGKWHWLANPWTLWSVIWYLTVNFLIDLSYFFNKTNLEIPPPHYLCAIRIWTLGFFSILATSDFYDYITKRKANSMGVNAFIIHVVIILEALLWMKNLDYNKIFKQDVYLHMKVVWLFIFAAIAAIHIFISVRQNLEKLGLKSEKKVVRNERGRKVKAN